MATRDIYETAFDEDVQADPTANQCPEYNGRVIINTAETIWEDCGLVIDDQHLDHGPEWRSFEATRTNTTERALHLPLHGTTVDSRLKSDIVPTLRGTLSRGRNDGGSDDSDAGTSAVSASRRPTGISHTVSEKSGDRQRTRPSRTTP